MSPYDRPDPSMIDAGLVMAGFIVVFILVIGVLAHTVFKWWEKDK
jgi:hypothetical protein